MKLTDDLENESFDMNTLIFFRLKLINSILLSLNFPQFARAAEVDELAIKVILDYNPEKMVNLIHRHQLQDDLSLVSIARKNDPKADLSQLKRSDGLIGVRFIEVDGQVNLRITNLTEKRIRFVDELMPIELEFAMKPKSKGYIPSSGIWRKFGSRLKEGIPPKEFRTFHLKGLYDRIHKNPSEIYKYPALAVRCRMVLIIGDETYSIVDVTK